MNSNINGMTNAEYTLEDAFEIIKSSLGDSYQIINSIISSQKQKYEEIIKLMDKKIGILNNQIDKLKNENSKLKSTTIQLQNKLITLSNNLRQLSNDDYNVNKKTDIKKNFRQNKLLKNKEKIKEIQNDIEQESNVNDSINNQNFNKNDDNYFNNDLFNLNKQTIDIEKIKNSFNHQLSKYKIKKEKTFTKGFNNKDNTPTRIIQKESNLFINENESQSSNSLENNYNKNAQSKTISNTKQRRKALKNLAFNSNNNLSNIENGQQDKFNNIAKRIKHLQKGLNINNPENNNDINTRFYTTYSLNRRNYSNMNDFNLYDN